MKQTEGAGKLDINSLADKEAKTTVKNGVTYSKREVLLDGFYDYIQDILVANVGTEAGVALYVELKSDVVELDKY